MVSRQTALHLADDLWMGYPMQPILDFVMKHADLTEARHIFEVGGGVGRIIGTIAENNPQISCWSIDYSYQLLKRSKEYWMEHATIKIDGGTRGMGSRIVRGRQLSNLQVGLAKAEDLPFDDASQDLLVHSFLLDRLDDPYQGLLEMLRVLKSGAKMIMVSPLNYLKRKHWQDFYPVEKLCRVIEAAGFNIEIIERDMMLVEPLDLHGNVVLWKCLGLVCSKM